MPDAPRYKAIKPPPPQRTWLSEIRAVESLADPLDYVLWRALRNVGLWAGTEPEARGDLFGPLKPETRELMAEAQATTPELAGPLGMFGLVLESPQAIHPQSLAEACHRVHLWADERGLLDLACHFAEAAARVDSESPRRANLAGRMCRRADQPQHGTVWYERAHGLAIRAGDDGERIRALIWYGSLLKDLGLRDEARTWYERAARSAARRGRDRHAAEAHHDLMMLCAELGEHDAVIKHARRAIRLYPQQHPRLPYLAHDFAYALITRRFYSLARVLLSLLRHVIVRADEEVLLYSTVCWANGGAGRREEFEAAECRVLQHIELHDEYATPACLHMASGARLLGDWQRAAEYAAQALKHAERRSDTLLLNEAVELVDQIAARVPGPREEVPADDEPIQQLARSLSVRLRKWKAPGRIRPGADYRASAARPEAVATASGGAIPGGSLGGRDPA